MTNIILNHGEETLYKLATLNVFATSLSYDFQDLPQKVYPQKIPWLSAG
jgi:hypothetical protein